MTLDDMHDILAWSPNELDPYRLGVLAQVALTILKIGVKAGLHEKADRERDRQRMLEELARRLDARKANGATADAQHRAWILSPSSSVQT